MNTCPNCGKVAGLHSSILQGCMCQYSMQAPPQRTWVGLTDEQIEQLEQDTCAMEFPETVRAIESKLKERNT